MNFLPRSRVKGDTSMQRGESETSLSLGEGLGKGIPKLARKFSGEREGKGIPKLVPKFSGEGLGKGIPKLAPKYTKLPPETSPQRKACRFLPWQVTTMRLLICLSPMPLWRKKKALTASLYYFNYWGLKW